MWRPPRRRVCEVCSPLILALCLALIWPFARAAADQVEMINGDRYVGNVLSLGSDTLILQNEYLGTLKLPRSRVASIGLGASPLRAGTNSAKSATLGMRTNRVAQITARPPTNSAPDFTSAIRGLNTNSSVVQQVQQQFLAGAGPEAQGKFNDLVSGLKSGRIGVNELRTEARNTLEQARSARKELGDEGSSLDSYLAILEGFLKETESSQGATNSPS